MLWNKAPVARRSDHVMRLPVLFAVVLGLSMPVIAACSAGQEPAAPVRQAAVPDAREQQVAAVRALLQAMDAEDADAIRASFSADATQAYGTQAWKTPERFRRWLESDIIRRKGKVEDPVLAFEGDTGVVVTGTYRSLGYQNAADFLFTVEGGKITRWRMRY